MIDPQPSNTGVKSSTTVAGEAVAVLAAGVDYLACSAGTPASADLLKAAGWALAYRQGEEGNDIKPWDWKGYRGIRAGSVECGERPDGVFVRVSGALAATAWRPIARHATHVSRLDLAVTVRLPSDANPAAEVYQTANPANKSGRGRRVQKGRHIETWSEGDTTYLGSRQSDRYGRIYDKGKESKDVAYRDCWRWEVEYKGDTATPLSHVLSSSDAESTAVLAYVWSDFEAFGAPPIWGLGAEVERFVSARPKSDDLRRLEWIRTQVAPSVRILIEHGRMADLLEALGLVDNQ